MIHAPLGFITVGFHPSTEIGLFRNDATIKDQFGNETIKNILGRGTQLHCEQWTYPGKVPERQLLAYTSPIGLRGVCLHGGTHYRGMVMQLVKKLKHGS